MGLLSTNVMNANFTVSVCIHISQLEGHNESYDL